MTGAQPAQPPPGQPEPTARSGRQTVGFVREFRHQMSLSFGTSGISPISMFASLGATPRWGRDTPVIGQRTAHAR